MIDYRTEFLKSVAVMDTETNNLIPEHAEIVELAAARYNGYEWSASSKLFGARNGIPPEASAKNHISKRMIDGLPTFAQAIDEAKTLINWPNSAFWVAHNCTYDQAVLSSSFIAASCNSDILVAQDTQRWICTYRLAKKVIPHDFKDMQYNLSFLRYKLDLPVSDDLPAHRAYADTMVCAVLFEFLVDYAIASGLVSNNETLVTQIHNLCWAPIAISNWPFGKNKGKSFKEIPTDYYLWALANMDCLNDKHADFNRDLAENIRIELESRLTS